MSHQKAGACDFTPWVLGLVSRLARRRIRGSDVSHSEVTTRPIRAVDFYRQHFPCHYYIPVLTSAFLLTRYCPSIYSIHLLRYAMMSKNNDEHALAWHQTGLPLRFTNYVASVVVDTALMVEWVEHALFSSLVIENLH